MNGWIGAYLMNGYKKRTFQKKLDILLATKWLISNIPFNEISIQSIANKAHVSQVTIYNIFTTKKLLIDEAVKAVASDDIQDIWDVISATTPIEERLPLYFHTSFNHSVSRPQHREIMAYIFRDPTSSLCSFVSQKYVATTPYLIKLYDDAKNEGFINDSFTLELFLKMLDIYTRTDRQFLTTQTERDFIVDCIIRSLR